jgi:hypothetical protein
MSDHFQNCLNDAFTMLNNKLFNSDKNSIKVLLINRTSVYLNIRHKHRRIEDA